MDIGMIFLLGVILCLSVRVTGSLWWAVGWHAAFDFGQLFIIGTRNGGQRASRPTHGCDLSGTCMDNRRRTRDRGRLFYDSRRINNVYLHHLVLASAITGLQRV